jgi:hypothetical protein
MKPVPDARRQADIDRLLGDKLLFDMKAMQPLGGPSAPTLYRARRAGLLDTVKNGGRTSLTRETAKRILLEGLGFIPWRPDGSDRIVNTDAGATANADA